MHAKQFLRYTKFDKTEPALNTFHVTFYFSYIHVICISLCFRMVKALPTRT